MPFDGRNYNGAPINGPVYAHPGAPATPHLFANALEQAYYRARRGGRVVGLQTYFQLSARARFYLANLTGFGIRSTGYVDWARFIRYVPNHFTHAMAWARFRVVTSGAPFASLHRLEVTDGTTTKTGDATRSDHASNEALDRLRLVTASTIEALPVAEAMCEVELATLTLGQDVRFLYEGKVTGEESGGTVVSETVRPEAVLVWLEARG